MGLLLGALHGHLSSTGGHFVRAGNRSNCTIARGRPSGKTRKETFSKRPPESYDSFCPPLPLPERFARKRPDCPSLSGDGSRGAEATVYWDKGRTRDPQRSPARFLAANSCLAPPPKSQGPAPAPSSLGEVAPAPRTPPLRRRTASFSTAARTAPGPAPKGRSAAKGRRGRAGEGSRR